jgi:hypothetical protein
MLCHPLLLSDISCNFFIKNVRESASLRHFLRFFIKNVRENASLRHFLRFFIKNVRESASLRHFLRFFIKNVRENASLRHFLRFFTKSFRESTPLRHFLIQKNYNLHTSLTVALHSIGIIYYIDYASVGVRTWAPRKRRILEKE